MNHDPHSATQGNRGFEHKDISVAAVMYFILGLAVALFVSYFVVRGVYSHLTRRFEAQQPAVSPLVTNVPSDTRKLPEEYKTDSKSADYEKYLQKNFPQPQLETNERSELNDVRLREEDILSTYDYVDKNAGTVRVPIDRAMDLLVQRGLPVRAQAADESKSQPQQNKEKK
jgi:hypothetical protein